MKRLVLSLVFVFTLTVFGVAQVFVLPDEDGARKSVGSDEAHVIVPLHNVEYDQTNYVPLGGGLFALAAMGMGYLLSKSRKDA